ncbi:unnamed protein product [Soboliphyme baturini]|uniref:Chloride channel protein n=1 Tax=Soboliphyme baturini TaxID=241478 RepID=A0A183IIV7_9BILA|nr:unnamed protein product [Soboliphyme baturini]
MASGFGQVVFHVCMTGVVSVHFYLLLDVANVHPALQYFAWVLFTLTLILLATALCHYLSPQAAEGRQKQGYLERIKEDMEEGEEAEKEDEEEKVILQVRSNYCFALGSESIHEFVQAVHAVRGLRHAEKSRRSEPAHRHPAAGGVAAQQRLPKIDETMTKAFLLGAGIPEMKTILRGVVLKEYLTARTLIVKFIGLVMALSSGLPLGKESKGRNNEMLAAACAVGVASTYGAPVGETVLPYSPTSFPYEFPFDVKELIVFALLGNQRQSFRAVCGLGGAVYIWFFKRWTYLITRTTFVKNILSRRCTSLTTLARRLVQYLIDTFQPLHLPDSRRAGNCFTELSNAARQLTPREALETLFCNFSWNAPPANVTALRSLIRFWSYGQTSIYLVLCIYCVNMFWMTAISTTLPVPCGTFIPVFVTGAAFGRLVGELMALAFPQGISDNVNAHSIIPGAYAVVGAAAFSGAVTHAISTSVIVFEMTGQITHLLPTIISVLLANAVCARFQASLYDTSIYIKRLPYLPRIPPTSSRLAFSIHSVYVHNFMVRDVKYLTLDTTYRELLALLKAFPKLKTFPLVDQAGKAVASHQLFDDMRYESVISGALDSLILLGSVRREELMKLLEELIADEVRKIEVSTKRRLKESKSYSNLDEENIPSRPEAEAKLRRSVSQQSLHVLSTVVNYAKRTMENYDASFQELSEDPKAMLTRLYRWSKGQLDKTIDFERFNIDPAPMQLVEKTSLYKVHVLFSLLGLNRAYVTNLGRLVGVVALREVCQIVLTLSCSQITHITLNT